MDKLFVMMTTTDTRERAEELGREMVEKNIAACVQISGPLTSVYRWEGEIQQEEEVRLVIKTCGSRLEEAMAFLQKEHNYETPEIIVLEVAQVNSGYLEWACG